MINKAATGRGDQSSDASPFRQRRTSWSPASQARCPIGIIPTTIPPASAVIIDRANPVQLAIPG